MTAQQLKNSILQMAVQGKLVPQDPNDEPASVLLERIRAEKERLIKEKKIKREKNSSVIFKGADNTPYEKIGDEVRSLADLAPFEIPSSWEWCRVGDLFSNMSGLAYKKDALAIKADKMVRVLRGGNIGEERFYFKGDDVFISSELVKPELYLRKNYMITPAVSSLDHIGKIALIDKDYSDTVVGGFVLMLIPHFNDDVVSEYLLYAFAAKHHRDNCRNITHKSGQAFYNLSREQMMNLPVPIPPREEMGRIIAMLKRVLPKVADYAVVDTALQNLNGSFPETLKKSILQEAVQGKLVSQDPSDESAEALLERIWAEKQRLIKEGKIKKDKHESITFRRDNSHYEKFDGVERCIDDELPFEIPENWCWARLGSISSYVEIKQKVNAANADSAIWGLDLEDIEKGGRLIVRKTVGERKAIGDKTVFSKGDILYSKLRPYLLKILVAPERGICTPEIVPFQVYGGIVSEYIVNFLRSPYVDNLINSITYRVIGESVYQWKIIVFRFMIQCEYTIRSAARQSHSRDRPRQGADRELLR